MPIKPRAAVGYLAAILIPLAFASQWDVVFPALRAMPGIFFLLMVAVIARFCGFGPALLTIVTSGFALWIHVFRFLTTDPFSLMFREATYLTAAITIASISRRRSEEVRESDEIYRALVNLSPDGIGIADEERKIVLANSALARLVGAADADQLIGRRLIDFIHPDYVDDFSARFNDLRSGKEAAWKAVRWVRLDGSSIDVESAGVPVRRDGKVLFQGFVRDLTERKKTDQKLDESRRRLQALFDTAIDAFLFIGADGRYVDANPALTALVGYTREELLLIGIGDLSPSEDRVKNANVFRAILAAGKGSGEAVIRRKDGACREIEYRAVANVLPDLHVLLMHDITPRKQAERSLEQLSGRLLRLQDEERRRIAGQLHDTTAQSLAAVRLNLSRISRFPGNSDPAIKDAIEDSIALTEQSIAEVRTLSYLLHPPMIDEIGLVPSLRWYTRGFEERSGIAVTMDVTDDMDRFTPDVETAIFRIVQEALTNIQRHSGSLLARIGLRHEADNVRLEVEDSGRGMPVHLRGPEQALAATGVGIAGMRQRTRELGGEMEIRSEGDGTSIVVTIPVPAAQQ